MNKRDAYRRSYEPRVRATGPKVQDFKLYTEHLSPWERLRLKPQIDNVQHLLARLAMRLQFVTVATDAEWESARDQAERAWGDFQRAIDEAYAQMYAPRPGALARSPQHDPGAVGWEEPPPPVRAMPSKH